MFPRTVGNLGGVVGEGWLGHLEDMVCIFAKITCPMIQLEEMGF